MSRGSINSYCPVLRDPVGRAALKHHLEWFKRQVFGNKSEGFAPEPGPTQGEVFPVPSTQPEPRKSVPAHTRRVPKTDLANAGDALPFFDGSRESHGFCWTELGARHVGIIQSLIVTCRLHGVDPYTYLVDVLQHVGEHPAARVAELTPRLWKQHFAGHPLRSDLHGLPA